MEPLAIIALLPLRGLHLTFTLTAPTRLRFFHQPLVGALVRHLMGDTLADEARLWLEAPESGRVPFAQGDSYRITLWACRGGETLLETLVERLRRLPAGLPGAVHGLPLGANLRFASAADAFTGGRYEGVARLLPYDAAALARELDFYLAHPPTTLRLLAPARLLRPKQAGRPTKGEGRYVHDRGELVGDLLGQRIDDTLGALLSAVGAAAQPRGASRVLVTEDDIGWFDTAYYDADGDANPMGGIIGRATLDLIDPAALPALVLGQYVGIGQRRTFGWGRYRLETATGAGTRPPRRPSRGVLARAAEPANVELAYRSIRANADGRAAPDLDPLDEDLSALAWSEHIAPIDELLDAVAQGLRAAALAPPAPGLADALPDAADPAASAPPPHRAQAPAYGPRAEPLRGWILQREGKSARPLAVPPFAERVAQRAVLQVLRTDLDPLLSAASFGYRRGLSRRDARDRLQALYRQGYEWVYEADIDDFFDSVSHARLDTRLRSLLPDDPVVDQLMAWVAAPVGFRGEQIERPAGLPQGAPLSPLLANLLLDDFDADLEVMGFRLVRFADDFVIACRSREEAEAAAARVRQSLAEIDLSLNEDKSGITRFDRGFRFLGYTFLRDLAVDAAKAARQVDAPLRLEDLPPASWLARLARRVPRVLDNAPITYLPAVPAGNRAPAAPAARPAADPGGRPPPDPAAATSPAPGAQPVQRLVAPEPMSDEPCTLLVATEGSLLSTSNGRLHIASPAGQTHEQPLAAIGAVLLIGRQRITGPTLTAALEAGVPIHFASRGGRYQGVLSNQWPGPEGAALWLRQRASFTNPAFALPLAREVVSARIHNQVEVLRQRARTDADLELALASLRALPQRVPGAAGLMELNGIEGLAAAHFFQGIVRILPPDFGFTNRRRRPPPDPFNALLSLGYTLIYQRADAVLRAAGLLPSQGFYHQGHGRHAALASDLMECFRHLVERQALSMINRGELKPGDFLLDPQQGCRLSRPALHSYLAALSARLIAPLDNAADGSRGTLYDHLWRMARTLIAQLNGREGQFQAFRIK